MSQEQEKAASAWHAMQETTYRLWDEQRKALVLLNQAAFGVPDPQCLYISPPTQDGQAARVRLREHHIGTIWPKHLRTLAAEALAAADFFDLMAHES